MRSLGRHLLVAGGNVVVRDAGDREGGTVKVECLDVNNCLQVFVDFKVETRTMSSGETAASFSGDVPPNTNITLTIQSYMQVDEQVHVVIR